MTFVGIAGRDTKAEMEAFVERNGVGEMDHVADVDGAVWDVNRVPAQPAWVFIDGETGKSFTQFGELGTDTLTEVVSQLTET